MKVDIVGDIHGCYQELMDLLMKLGYQWSEGNIYHPRQPTACICRRFSR